VNQANGWLRAQRLRDHSCIGLSIDELRRANIVQPGWHLIRTFRPAHPVPAGRIPWIRSDADLVERDKAWIRFRYQLTDEPHTGHPRPVDRRVTLAETEDGRWWFVIGGHLHQRLCLLHVDEHCPCAQGNVATTDSAEPPAKVIRGRVPQATRKRSSIMAKLAKAKTATARFLVSLFDIRLWPTALSWLARALGARLLAVRWGRRSQHHSPHSVAADEPLSTQAMATVESAQTGWSVAAGAVPVHPVDSRAKPHKPLPTNRPPPPRRGTNMSRSASRSRAEQPPRRKVRRQWVEPREYTGECAPAKTMRSRRRATTAQTFVGRIPMNRLVSLVRTIAAQGLGAMYRPREGLARRISVGSSSQEPAQRPAPSTFSASRLKNRFRRMQLRTQARGAETKGDHVASHPTQTGRGWGLTKLDRVKATAKLFVSRNFEHGWSPLLSFVRIVATKIAMLLAKAAERWKQTRKQPTRGERGEIS
jgi:hypothetical protein